jgi:uncharacterized membrane protein
MVMVVSELVVLGFRDQYRAPEVLNELRRRELDSIFDLNKAVVVTRDEGGAVLVQLSINPMNRGGINWVKVWGSLLNLAMLRPVAGGMSAAVSNAAVPFTTAAGTPPEPEKAEPDAAWWKKNVRLSEDFIRDVGAITQPGYSALLLFLRGETRPALLRQLRGYGGTLLHATLGREDVEVTDALASG